VVRPLQTRTCTTLRQTTAIATPEPTMTRAPVLASILLVAAMTASLQLHAQNRQPQPEPVHGEGHRTTFPTDQNGLTIPAGEFSIEDLVDESAKFLGRNILYSDREFAAVKDGSYYFQKRLAVDARGCEELLYGLLFTKGFAVIPIDEMKGVYEVISMNGGRQREVVSHPVVRTPEEVLRRPNFMEYVVVSQRLEHTNVNHVLNGLRQMIANNGTGLMITSSNNEVLVLQGFGDQVASALRMVKEADVAQVLDAQDPVQQRLQQLEAAVKALQEKLVARDKPAAGDKPAGG
jgi:hypothetical protein